MVFTRYQARLQHILRTGETSDGSPDSEVSFNHNWLDRALLGRTVHSTHSSDDEPEHVDTDTDMADDRTDRRLTLLESAVMGMTEKFDELLSIVNPEQPVPGERRQGSRPSLTRGAAGVHDRGRHCSESRPPPALPNMSPNIFVGRSLSHHVVTMVRAYLLTCILDNYCQSLTCTLADQASLLLKRNLMPETL